MHHPFTRPKAEDLPLLEQKRFSEVRAEAYDVVLNGVEIGGGSIRIHERDLQAKMFEVLGLTSEETEQQFGHLLRAFRLGAPPHGGIALGLDRLVMLVCGEESIREVIAFPKKNRGQDLMSQSPSDVDAKQLSELGIKVASEEKTRRALRHVQRSTLTAIERRAQSSVAVIDAPPAIRAAQRRNPCICLASAACARRRFSDACMSLGSSWSAW